MEALYESLFRSDQLFCDQLVRWVMPEIADSGHLVVLVSSDRETRSSDDQRFGEVFEERGILDSICDRIDDGCDPILCRHDNHCVAACELYTETKSVGYLVLVLSGYTPETARMNMDLIEMLFAQFRLVCSLLERNNEFHQLKLVDMSKKPSNISC